MILFLLLPAVFSHPFLTTKTNTNHKDFTFVKQKASNLILSYVYQVHQSCLNKAYLILTNSQNANSFHFLINQWDEFFNNASPNLTFTVKRKNTQLKINVDKIYILSCTFVEAKSTTANGGAIFFYSSDDSLMLIEESVFYNCHSSLSGGAIYMGIFGYFAINKCCSNFCFTSGTPSFGQFACTEGESSKIFECSIINSKPETSESSNTINQRNSNITIETVNISQNTCNEAPLGSLYLQNECLIHLCSFENNTGTRFGISFSSSQSPITMTSSNLIGNTIKQNGLIYSSNGELTINGCTIHNNNEDVIIFNSHNDGSINVKNCTMSNDDATKFLGNVNLDNWKPSSNFFNEISLEFIINLCIALLKKEDETTEYWVGSFLFLIVLLNN